MGFTETYVVMMVLACALVVHAWECKGPCNIVVCGENNLKTVHRTMDKSATQSVITHFAAFKLAKTCLCGGSIPCFIGAVMYKGSITGACQAPQSNWRKCIRNMEKTENDDVNNKLELCFKKVNEGEELLKVTNSNCNYQVVVVASPDLTNSDVEVLKAEARKLKEKNVTIRCYLVGESSEYDDNYDAICNGGVKQVRHGGACTTANNAENNRTCSYESNLKWVYEDLKCCQDKN